MASHTMPPPTQPQPVNRNGRSSLGMQDSVAGPSSIRMGASPMAGISFTNGGGFSFDKSGGRSVRQGNAAGSYGARFYGGGFDSPSHPFSTSITMDGSSFNTSSAAFNLPPPLSTSASFRGGRSYAAAAKGERDHPLRSHHTGNNPGALSTSFASMSFQPMSFSFGAGSYSKSQVHSLMARDSSANRARTDAELTRTYECCGNTHHGLHDLLEHVEDAHPFMDSEPVPGERPTPHIGFSPQVLAMEMDMDVAEAPNLGTIEERGSGAGSPRDSMSPKTAPPIPTYPVPTSASSSKPSTPNEGAPSPAALQISDILTSPFASYLVGSPKPPTQPPSAASNASTSSSPPEVNLTTPMTSQQPSPVFAVPKVGPTRGFLGSTSRLPQQRFDRAFNEVVAGSPKSAESQLPGAPKPPKSNTPTAVAPGVLFASAVANLGIPTTPPIPGQPVDSTTAPTTASGAAQDSTSGNAASGIAGSGFGATEPTPSPFTISKPWRCPTVGCSKVYKQSNGLKYHLQRGICDKSVTIAVDNGLTLEEAEEKSRPFVCAVGAGCTKRYRQLNGLKYHYLNSAEHGQYGLRLLQLGTHPTPASTASGSNSTPNTTPSAPKPTPTASTSTPTASSSTPTPTNPSLSAIRRPIPTSTSTNATATSSAATASTASRPYHIPSQIGATRPRMGVFPTTGPAHGRAPAPGSGIGGLAGIGRAGVPVRPSVHSATGGAGAGGMQGQKPPPAQLPPIQRGRDAVLFAMDL